jgi:RimJ/RimL family protein N-acetyltransferase
MRYVFDELGYRRLEWKCDSNNKRSKNCARRLGFSFEGVFRQHWMMKGHNRDTAWFSIIDSEWPAIKAKLKAWLQPDNFAVDGSALSSLCDSQ